MVAQRLKGGPQFKPLLSAGKGHGGGGGQDSVHPCGTLAAVLGDIGEERAPGNTRWVRHAECSLGVDH